MPLVDFATDDRAKPCGREVLRRRRAKGRKRIAVTIAKK
jgi:hypothetical protein